MIPLTFTEVQALNLLLTGVDNRTLAARLGLDYPDVVQLVRTLFGKTGMRNRTALAVWWWHQVQRRQREVMP